MRGCVIKPFFDLANPQDVYSIGDTFEGTAERVTDLAQRGFVEVIEEKKKKTAKKPKKEQA